MPYKHPLNRINAKDAHRKALARLTEEFPGEYKVLLDLVRKHNPGITSDGVTRKARSWLRVLKPVPFARLLQEERNKYALRKGRDFDAIVAQAIEMHNEGHSTAFIARELSVDYRNLRRRIKAYRQAQEERGSE